MATRFTMTRSVTVLVWSGLMLVGLISIGASHPPHAPTALTPAAYWEDHLARILDHAAVGYAYAIYQNGTPVAVGGKGYARAPLHPADPGVAMTADTRIQIASVSKSITAVALLHALQQRNISPDTTLWALVKDTFPEVGAGVKDITLAHLLSHTSGYGFAYIGSPRLENTRKLLAQPVPHPVGTKYRYSNINSSLARTVLEALTGEDYAAYVRRALLRPAGAEAMRLVADSQAVAYAYKMGGDLATGRPIADDFRDEGAAYGWYATARELAGFLRQVRTHTYLTPERTQDMLTRGLGWGRRDTPAGPAYRHDGQWVISGKRGVRTGIALLPDGVEAVLLINTNGPYSPSDILLRGFRAGMPRMAALIDKKASTAMVYVERPAHADAVRWTVDGSTPNAESPQYHGPAEVPLPATVRVQGFRQGVPVTFVHTRTFPSK